MTPIYLKTDFISQNNSSCRGNRVYFNLGKELSDQLTQLAQTCQTSMHRILLASMYALLYFYTDQNDLCIGTASANRRGYAASVNDLVGCFVNSIPVRAKNVNGQLNFLDLLKMISEAAINAYKNQLSYDLIAGKGSPFNIIFDFNQKRTGLTLKNVEASYPNELNLNYSKFKYFGVNIDELINGLYGGFIEYNRDLFNESTIIRLTNHLQNILSCFVKNPQEKLSSYYFLTPEEDQILTEANNTSKPTDFSKSIGEIFIEKVNEVIQRDPEATSYRFSRKLCPSRRKASGYKW